MMDFDGKFHEDESRENQSMEVSLEIPGINNYIDMSIDIGGGIKRQYHLPNLMGKTVYILYYGHVKADTVMQITIRDEGGDCVWQTYEGFPIFCNEYNEFWFTDRESAENFVKKEL